ncbi:MAG: DUF4435 domain-containing protein [Fimbriimonas sp.]
MSSKAFIIVEGSSDVKFYFHVRNALAKAAQVEFISAETINDLPNGLPDELYSNRGKIEYILDKYVQHPESYKLYGFCDRELDRFELAPNVKDLAIGGWRNGNVCYTGRHSIENYFFDEGVIRRFLHRTCHPEIVNEIWDHLDRNLTRLLALATSIAIEGMVGISLGELSKLSQLESCFESREVLTTTMDGLVEFDALEAKLKSERGVSSQHSHSLCARLKSRLSSLEGCERNVLLSMARGHTIFLIVMSMLSEIIEIVQSVKWNVNFEVQSSSCPIRSLTVTNRFDQFINTLYYCVKEGSAQYPEICLQAV